jgi:hypothetical protein
MVGLALHEPLSLQLDDQLGDRGRSYLLGPRELAEGDGAAAEDDDGERGELWGGEAGGVILAAEAAEEVDGGGVEAIGEVRGGEACGAGARRARA